MKNAWNYAGQLLTIHTSYTHAGISHNFLHSSHWRQIILWLKEKRIVLIFVLFYTHASKRLPNLSHSVERGELAASKYKVEILVKSVTSFDYEVFIVSRIHTYSRSCTQIFTIVFPSPIANREQGENNTWKQLNRALIKRIYMKYVRRFVDRNSRISMFDQGEWKKRRTTEEGGKCRGKKG